MISKKVYTCNNSTKRFLSDFIIRSDQFARPYVFIYDNTLATDGTEDVLQSPSLPLEYPTNLYKRGNDTAKSEDLVTSDKWQVVDNSILFYSAPPSGSTVWVEVATTSEEFGTTLIAQAVSTALTAAETAHAASIVATTKAAEAVASEVAAALSVIDAQAEAVNAANAGQLKVLEAQAEVVNAANAGQLKAWEAEAEKMTAESYAIEPEDIFVKNYTSNGDGTYTTTTTSDYSALHWSNRADIGGGIVLLENALLEHVDDSGAGHLQDAIATIEMAQQVGLNKSGFQLPKDSRVGELVKTTGSNPFGDCVKANGALLKRSEYPALWAFAESCGNIYTEEEWEKKQYLGYSFGDGESTFRVPDWRGRFERAWDDGKNIDPSRKLGSGQNDMFKSHNHGTGGDWRPIFYAGANRWGYYMSGDPNNYSDNKPDKFKGGSETRPKNGAVLYCIKFKD